MQKKNGILLLADDRMPMTGISIFGALVASNTTPSILKLKPVRLVSNVTKQDTLCESQQTLSRTTTQPKMEMI
jgi:hypothetical protein